MSREESIKRKRTGRLLTVREVADMLGKKESGVRTWILFRKIPYVKVGRSVRISEATVDEIIEKGTIPAREEWRGRH